VVAQLRRAAWSVANNIAEGNARRGRGELRQFLNVAIGSLAEVDGMVDTLPDLYPLDEQNLAAIEVLRQEITRGLSGSCAETGAESHVLPSSRPLVSQNRNGGPILSDRPPSPHQLPGVRGLTPAVLLPATAARTDPSAEGDQELRLHPQASGRTTRFAGASAASRIASRSDPSHGMPRRHVGTDEARELASPARVGVATRIVGRRALDSWRSPRNSRSNRSRRRDRDSPSRTFLNDHGANLVRVRSAQAPISLRFTHSVCIAC